MYYLKMKKLTKQNCNTRLITMNEIKQSPLYKSKLGTGISKLKKTELCAVLFPNDIPRNIPKDIPKLYSLKSSIPNKQIVYVGHGIRKRGSLSHEEIHKLREKYKNNKILKYAFALIEGADMAVVHDLQVLLERIQANAKKVNVPKLIKTMENDRTIIVNALTCFDSGNDKEPTFKPLLDLLELLAIDNQGIDKAIEMLEQYQDQLLEGKIPNELQDLSSLDAISLRIVLFYIEKAKNKTSDKISVKTFKSFCPVSYFGKEQYLEKSLMQTSFYENGEFLVPTNGYVKNAMVCHKVSLKDEMKDIDINWQSQPKKYGNLIFSDCSGFAQALAQRFYPSNEFLNDKRQMSYQLAPLYDFLANKQMKTENKFYDVNGKSKKLSEHEITQIKKYSLTIKNLKSIYTAIINPLENLLPGDIIISRKVKQEGHVMIVVEPSIPVKVIELTAFNANGYNWKNAQLLPNINNDTKYRVLRIIT